MTITLVEQHQAPGIGWFDQRSVHLDAAQWKQLRSMFGRIESFQPAEEDDHTPRDILRFPGVTPAVDLLPVCQAEGHCPILEAMADEDRNQQVG